MNEHDIKKLSDCLGKYPVIIAYLFGSEAHQNDGGQVLKFDIFLGGGDSLPLFLTKIKGIDNNNTFG